MDQASVSSEYWRKCSTCKSPIAYKHKHFICSVSTCHRPRTGFVFCSLPCFERHLPGARHRDAYALEEISPSYEAWIKEISPPSNQILTPASSSHILSHQTSLRPNQRTIINPSKTSMEMEILVVASKVKDYIKRRSEMNTSHEVLRVLSHKIRKLCDEAMESAQREGRKTVMERDFKN